MKPETGRLRFSRVKRGLGAGLLALLLAWAVAATGALEHWEYRTWDWRAQLLAAPERAHPDIVLILLDQDSLDWAGRQHGLSWPWPRELYGAVADFCRRGGAKALALDVLFLEPSSYGVADDQALGESLAAFGPLVGAAFPGETTGQHRSWPPEWPLADLTLAPELPGRGPEPVYYPRAALPIAPVGTNVSLLANVQLAPDSDGIYRRVPLLAGFDGRLLPVLGLAPYLAARPQEVSGRGVPQVAEPRDRLPQAGPGDRLLRWRAGHLLVGGDELPAIPVDDEGRALLRYRGPAGTFPAYSAAAVLQGEIHLRHGESSPLDPELFRDKYVFLGFSAPGLYDLRPTPMGGLYPGVEIHATILDNLLSGDFMRPAPAAAGLLAAAVPALGGAMLLSFIGSAVAIALLVLTMPLLPAAATLAAYQLGWWLPLVMPLLALLAAMLLTLLANYVTEGRQKRFIKGAFQQYLSPTVIEQLLRQPERLRLGGERRELSIFFSDLEGFTSISEGLDPEALTALLNDYLSAMTAVIHEEGGTVDKYEGDAIIAFWNAPLEQPDHARRAVRAALRCQQQLAEMRPDLQQRCGHELKMRIGINTGPAVVGNLGSSSRFDYTMLGDAVNLAARLEGANKAFGIYTMISRDTAVAAGLLDADGGRKAGDRGAQGGAEAVLREIGRLAVVGRREPVTVYQPLAPPEAAARAATLERFAAALAHFYQGEFSLALAGFSAAGQAEPPDPAAAAYAARCRELLATPPPPGTWQGVWQMQGK